MYVAETPACRPYPHPAASLSLVDKGTTQNRPLTYSFKCDLDDVPHSFRSRRRSGPGRVLITIPSMPFENLLSYQPANGYVPDAVERPSKSCDSPASLWQDLSPTSTGMVTTTVDDHFREGDAKKLWQLLLRVPASELALESSNHPGSEPALVEALYNARRAVQQSMSIMERPEQQEQLCSFMDEPLLGCDWRTDRGLSTLVGPFTSAAPLESTETNRVGLPSASAATPSWLHAQKIDRCGRDMCLQAWKAGQEKVRRAVSSISLGHRDWCTVARRSWVYSAPATIIFRNWWKADDASNQCVLSVVPNRLMQGRVLAAGAP